jgi:hypothetical protein
LWPTQADAFALVVYAQDFHLDDIAHTELLVAGDTAAMKEAVLFDADVYEAAEIYHVAYCALEGHASLQIGHGEDITAEDGGWHIFAGIAARTNELLKDVFEGRYTSVEFTGKLV